FLLLGSVYEMFGNECCLPTGEVIKVVGFKITNIIAECKEDNDEGHCMKQVELPLDFPALFKVIADSVPYFTIGEITRSLQIGQSRLGRPHFQNNMDMHLDGLTIKQGECIIIISLTEVEGKQCVNCEVNRDGESHNFSLPLSYEGEFCECSDDQFYTLKEILDWKIPKSRKRTVKLAKALTNWDLNFSPLPMDFIGDLILVPVYEIQAVMKFRKDIVHIPSNLDVEVIDVTDSYDINSFVQPLSVNDIFERPCKEFPLVAEIIEGPDPSQAIYRFMQPGKEIVIHQKCQSKRILASELRSDTHKRHFLIPNSYKGKLKRRPREFPTAYDLEIAKAEKEQLHVVATKAFTTNYTELASVLVGDQFLIQKRQTVEVSYKGIKKKVDVLACEKIIGKDYEQVLLPMYMEGGFVEVIHDKKQYYLSKVCEQFHLPFNVTVSVRDLSMTEDILAAVSGLQIEEQITDPYLLVSFFDNPEDRWEVPVHRVNMSLQLISKSNVKPESSPTRTIVEEISEEFYYMLRRYENTALHPPPRPPKKPVIPVSEQVALSVPQQKKPDPPKSPKVKH
uniref:Thymocyte selection associated n=1 Tax=Latimeria chalumnae TaxID=7897 RepID=H3AMY8_LATCH